MTPAEIRILRKRLGMTQKGLARELGVEYHAIIAWEKGRRKPLPAFARVLQALAVVE